jgi:ketosteroid isomerase-like protein
MDTTPENVTLVRNLYAAFSRGDVAALLGAVSPDVEWGEPDNPFNPSAGTRRGHAGVLEWLRLGKDAEEILALEPKTFIAQDDRVVVVGHTSCRVRRTAKIYNTDFVHVVTIAHGKVERFREFFDTFAAAEAFKPDPGPASWRPRRAVALLIVFALAFLSFFEFVQPWYARWGATDEEVIARLPGDEIVQGAVSEQTRAITIHAPVERVWPWLAQLGQNRGGFYSYDALENLVGCDMPTEDVLRPDKHAWAIGDRLWMYPPEAAGGIGFAVLRDYVPDRVLAFGTHIPGAADIDTGSWAFVLRPLDKDTTRLLVRSRVQTTATTTWLERTFDRAVFSPMHFAMERRMMIGLKDVAETGTRSRLSNHVQVGLWTVTLALLIVAVVLVFARRFWGRALAVACAAVVLFAYLTLRQPSLFFGVLLVGWLVLNLVDAPQPGKSRGKVGILRPGSTNLW